MKRWSDYDRRLSIFILRVALCTMEETSSILSCRKEAVTEAEQWIKSCSLKDAINFFDDHAIKRLVNQVFPDLMRTEEDMTPEHLVRAAQLTAHEILCKYRQDYRGRTAECEQLQRYLALLQQWRGQIQFLSLGQFLNEFWFKNLQIDLQREIMEPEEVAGWHFDIYERHWKTTPGPFRATLSVESQSLFEQLKKSYPDAEIWLAQESWGNANGIYIDAFLSWVTDVGYITESVLGSILQEECNGELEIEVADARRVIKKVKRENPDTWSVIRLFALALACDLLLLGIREQPPHLFWTPEAYKISELRIAIVHQSMKELPQDFWLTGTNRVHAVAKILWDKDYDLKEKTINLLQTRERLQTTQNDAQDKLKAFELILSSSA